MGLPQKNLYATNIGYENGDLLLSCWEPVLKKDGNYYMPPNTPIGLDMPIKNSLGLKFEDGIVPVKVVESGEDTGLWLACFDDYFGNEQHLFNYKPEFKVVDGKKTKRINYEDFDEDDVKWELHIWTDIKMVAGDGPISVKLVRK